MVHRLVVGANGMSRQDLRALLAEGGHEVTRVDRTDGDITDAAATRDVAQGYSVVVNCTAYTAAAAAFSVNAVGAANLARAAAAASERMVQISTDNVFDGSASSPYAEDARVAPHSAYGRTKCAGEWAVPSAAPDQLVVRAELPGITVVDAGSNTGSAGGCNLGVAHAKGELLTAASGEDGGVTGGDDGFRAAVNPAGP